MQGALRSDSVTLRGNMLSAQVQSGTATPVCVSTTDTFRSGRGDEKASSLGRKRVGGLPVRAMAIPAVCSSSGGEHRGVAHSTH